MKLNEFEELKLMNDVKITYLKKMGKDTSRNEVIKEILKDNECFNKIEKEDAYIILQDIGVQDDKIEGIYNELTNMI